MIAQRDALLTARFGGARGQSNDGQPSIAANGFEVKKTTPYVRMESDSVIRRCRLY